MLKKRKAKNMSKFKDKTFKIIDKYEGFKIPSQNWKIDRIKPDIDPKILFEKYIKTRTPVLIEGIPVQNHIIREDWTWENMEGKAGHLQVEIEHRDTGSDSFGTGKEKVKMKFGDFLNIQEDKEKYYMTTQTIEYDDTGPTILCQPPVIEILDNLHFKPDFIGNLIVNQLNIWMGYSGEEGSTTVISHIVMNGRKKFKLYSPNEVKTQIKVQGKVKKIHKNGLITYFDEVQSDGHVSDDEVAYGKKQNLLQKIQKLELEIEQKKKNGVSVQDIKELMDQQLEQALEGGDKDDFEELNGPIIPDNFVLNHNKINANFGEIEINAGEILYLPASWFHQVNSYGGKHLAFNIWLHPPNNNSFENPYKSDHWQKRYQVMLDNTIKWKEELNMKK